jgi:NADPH:quinone reductase-like Zn-dependent oxidoreductase
MQCDSLAEWARLCVRSCWMVPVADMASAGRLHTPVAREFNVEDARAAYEEFISGPHRGWIVLTF